MHAIKWDKRAERRWPAQLNSQSRTIKKNQSIGKAAFTPITWSCVTNKGQIILVNLFLCALSLRWCIPAHTGSAPAVWRSRCRQRWPSPCTAAAPGRPCSSVTAERTDDTRHEKTKNPMRMEKMEMEVVILKLCTSVCSTLPLPHQFDSLYERLGAGQLGAGGWRRWWGAAPYAHGC